MYTHTYEQNIAHWTSIFTNATWYATLIVFVVKLKTTLTLSWPAPLQSHAWWNGHVNKPNNKPGNNKWCTIVWHWWGFRWNNYFNILSSTEIYKDFKTICKLIIWRLRFSFLDIGPKTKPITVFPLCKCARIQRKRFNISSFLCKKPPIVSLWIWVCMIQWFEHHYWYLFEH